MKYSYNLPNSYNLNNFFKVNFKEYKKSNKIFVLYIKMT